MVKQHFFYLWFLKECNSSNRLLSNISSRKLVSKLIMRQRLNALSRLFALNVLHTIRPYRINNCKTCIIWFQIIGYSFLLWLGFHKVGKTMKTYYANKVLVSLLLNWNFSCFSWKISLKSHVSFLLQIASLQCLQMKINVSFVIVIVVALAFVLEQVSFKTFFLIFLNVFCWL
jgi:hypothetical protein